MICQVCGDSTSCTHYGGKCCMSCKAFFRRFARHQRKLLCRTSTNQCLINVETRRHCPACRLNLCLAAGMKIEYVWTVEENLQRQVEIESKRRRLTQIKFDSSTIDRFQEQRRSLTAEQSTLVSNLVHHFDFVNEQQTQEFHHLRKSLPLKFRLKLSNYEDLLRIYFKTGQHFIEGIPPYRDLNANYRFSLGNRSLTVLVALNIMNSMNLTDFRPHLDKDFRPFHELFYSREAIDQGEIIRLRVKKLLDIDRTVMKLFLAILTFTHLTCDMTTNSNDDQFYLKQINERQNEFIELIWSYMSYRLENERMLVNLFTKLISTCLQIQIFVADRTIREENSAVQLSEIIEKTKSNLLITNDNE